MARGHRIFIHPSVLAVLRLDVQAICGKPTIASMSRSPQHPTTADPPARPLQPARPILVPPSPPRCHPPPCRSYKASQVGSFPTTPQPNAIPFLASPPSRFPRSRSTHPDPIVHSSGTPESLASSSSSASSAVAAAAANGDARTLSPAGEAPTLIPGLPDDLTVVILASLPYSHQARLCATSRSWNAFLTPSSPPPSGDSLPFPFPFPIPHHLLRHLSSTAMILCPSDPSAVLTSKQKSRATLSLLKSEKNPACIVEIYQAADLTPASHLDRTALSIVASKLAASGSEVVRLRS